MASAGTNTGTITSVYKDPAGTVTVKTESVTYDASFDIERINIDVAATNLRFNIALTLSTVKMCAMGVKRSAGEISSKTVNATVKVNSTSSPTKTLTLTDTNGVGWSTGDSNAITDILGSSDITALYVTNNGTSKIDFFFRGIYDSTPVEGN